MNNLPLFMQESKVFEIFKIVKKSIPRNAKAYLVGGGARNAVYFKFFKKRLPQRDYDIIYIGNKEQFIRNLRNNGFVYGKIRRKNDLVLKKKKVPKPCAKKFTDYVILDIHFSEEKSISESVNNGANFTINGFALSLKYVDSKDWYNHKVVLPTAEKDLKNKQLRINANNHPANLFSCIRFMSQGFKQPSKKEIDSLLLKLGDFEKWRYPRNIQKLYDYVGGEKEARKLVKKLGIKQNIFDYKEVRKLKAK